MGVGGTEKIFDRSDFHDFYTTKFLCIGILAPLALTFRSAAREAFFPHLPPLLVQRCNDTSAGLGYLKVSMAMPCKSPPSVIGSVRTTPIGGNVTIAVLT
jgi:hypothetical protein